MEEPEPELTQLTMNDSTLLDDELSQEFPVENLTTENEIQSFSQVKYQTFFFGFTGLISTMSCILTKK